MAQPRSATKRSRSAKTDDSSIDCCSGRRASSGSASNGWRLMNDPHRQPIAADDESTEPWVGRSRDGQWLVGKALCEVRSLDVPASHRDRDTTLRRVPFRSRWSRLGPGRRPGHREAASGRLRRIRRAQRSSEREDARADRPPPTPDSPARQLADHDESQPHDHATEPTRIRRAHLGRFPYGKPAGTRPGPLCVTILAMSRESARKIRRA
jgi:hypothetical protein